MKIVAFTLLLASAATFAQTPATEFPEGATAITADALKAALAGKVYAVQPAKGLPWRWQFKDDGYFFLNVGNFADSGKWVAKDTLLCSEPRQIRAGCNEVRSLGADLYLKRDSGEVVKMSAQ